MVLLRIRHTLCQPLLIAKFAISSYFLAKHSFVLMEHLFISICTYKRCPETKSLCGYYSYSFSLATSIKPSCTRNLLI